MAVINCEQLQDQVEALVELVATQQDDLTKLRVELVELQAKFWTINGRQD